jgi:hypothetical protein
VTNHNFRFAMVLIGLAGLILAITKLWTGG